MLAGLIKLKDLITMDTQALYEENYIHVEAACKLLCDDGERIKQEEHATVVGIATYFNDTLTY